MGRVRTSIVKRTARRLLELYPSEVSEDFEGNKKLVSKYVYVRSRKLRNKIAGYLTHLAKVKERLEKVSVAKAEA